jgi:hypothetical protein
MNATAVKSATTSELTDQLCMCEPCVWSLTIARHPIRVRHRARRLFDADDRVTFRRRLTVIALK